MSRLTTKQRRARLWRRSWVKHVALIRAEWTPKTSWTQANWNAAAPDLASYSMELEKSHLGRKVPGPFLETTW